MSKCTGWKVNLWEHERGWGSKIDDVVTFQPDDYQKALDFVERYNSVNTKKQVPDWYMRAEGPFPIIE